MKRMTLVVIVVLLFCIAGYSLAWSAPEVFVKNKPLAGKTMVKGHLYVDFQEFLKKAGYSWKISGDRVDISSEAGGGPNIGSKPSNFSFDGAVFNVSDFMSSSGKLYVHAQNLANRVSVKYRYTADTGSWDFYTIPKTIPTAPAAVESKPAHKVSGASTKVSGSGGSSAAPADSGSQPAAPESSDSGSGDDQGGKIVTVKEISKSLIKPKNDFFWDWNQGDVRGTVYYTNTADKKVTDISIKFMVCDGYGKPLQTWTHKVGDLDPGAKSQTYEYYYLNPSKFNINSDSFRYEFTYKQPKKDKKEDKKEEKKE